MLTIHTVVSMYMHRRPDQVLETLQSTDFEALATFPATEPTKFTALLDDEMGY
jgi:hypothetical protein